MWYPLLFLESFRAELCSRNRDIMPQNQGNLSTRLGHLNVLTFFIKDSTNSVSKTKFIYTTQHLMKVKASELLFFFFSSPFFNKRQISYHLLFYLNNVPKMNICSQFFLERTKATATTTTFLSFFAKSLSLRI